MKKLFAMILAGTLAAGTLSACGSTAVVAVPQPETSAPPASEPTTPAPQTGESAGEGAVKTGLYLGTDLSSSKPAADGEDGLAQANINLVAVTISEDGVIDESERELFGEIVTELDGIIQAATNLKVSEHTRT